jgi:cytochrome b6-f complex subunit 5
MAKSPFVSIAVTSEPCRIHLFEVLFLSMIGRHEPSIRCLLLRSFDVVEPLLSGIVLGLIPITLAGLFVAAYLQYKRGNELEL